MTEFQCAIYSLGVCFCLCLGVCFLWDQHICVWGFSECISIGMYTCVPVYVC